MFVSMECIFRGFDYAVQAPDGNKHIVARNEETAFLTRHLRSYGGTGEYQDHSRQDVEEHNVFRKGFC